MSMQALPSLRRRLRLRLRRSIVSLLLAACALALPTLSTAADVVTRQIVGAAFDDVALAVVDAIAAEGITPPSVSHFGDMLRRTAPELGHPPALFADARIYTFCSAAAAARLSIESAHQIALCPLSIAVYQLDPEPSVVHLGYRRSAGSAGGAAVDALLERIVERAARDLQ